MLSLAPKQTLSMQTRDGVRLDADVYRPAAPGDYPVLLMRQPYGRAIASTVVYAHPTWYAAHGYIVVIQDVRGRGTSAGNFELFAHEIADGEDAVTWAAALPGSTGQVGMYGFSYQGMTQLYAAATRPSALKVLCPAMVGYDLYADWAYEGGAFCLQANLGWAVQLAAETARLRGDEPAYHALFAASRQLPLQDLIPANPRIMQELAPDSFYHAWLAHPQPDSYWERLSPKHCLQAVDLPMLHIGGWFDPFLRGTLHLYEAMTAQSTQPQQLWIGPWAHLPWGRKVGAIDYSPAASTTIDRLQLRWFDQYLKGKDRGLETEAPVQLFELGSNRWRSFNHWPLGQPTPFFLTSTGLAAMNEQEGTLVDRPVASTSEDAFVHDPWRPVPALGGHASIPAGTFDRTALDSRSDIVTYTSAPLAQDLYLTGQITVEVWCIADQPSFDLCAVVSEVTPNGTYNFAQGYMHVPPAQSSQPLRIALQPICIRLPQGHALRLSLSAACFPAYPVNPGTGSPLTTARLMDAQIITLTIRSGGEFPSHLVLPIVLENFSL